MAIERSSGIILHPTSLPSRGGIGDLGPAAYAFADFLHAARQTVWQVLPLGPTGWGNSPYASTSAFAGNPLLISLEKLVEAGWLGADQIAWTPPETSPDKVDFHAVLGYKPPLLAQAARNFIARGAEFGEQWSRFEAFCSQQAHWLNDYAFSVVLRNQLGTSWPDWPMEFRRRDPAALARAAAEHGEALAIEQALQFAFDEQWQQLRHYCCDRDIKIMGDVAIFVNYDSVDVWSSPESFDLDEDMRPRFVSGVPPDYFSETGQRWGNPLYKWDELAKCGYDWWIARIRRSMEIYDLVRLDHFRGFEAYWQIPESEATAVHGKWVKGPGAQLFTALRNALADANGQLPFIAEDLGVITPEVEAIRLQFDMPGMRVLQFGFNDRGAHSHLPHRLTNNMVVYTGTHDNDTTLGWWMHGTAAQERTNALAYLEPGQDGVVWAMIRAAETSVADLCCLPAQDILCLGSEARMNTPALPEGNWAWRLRPGALTPQLAAKLALLMEVADRDHVPPEPLPELETVNGSATGTVAE